MNRKQLEHLLRAGGSLSGTSELVVIESQAILGSCPDAPPELLTSMEANLFPLKEPEKADLIDGSIGELSPFHETFGYYAHGVGPETAVLPARWKSRLVRVENENTGGIVGWCLSPADLAVSKLAAGREKDLDFVRGLLKHRLVSEESIRQVLIELPGDRAQAVASALARCNPG